jgi:hypothetical protein
MIRCLAGVPFLGLSNIRSVALWRFLAGRFSGNFTDFVTKYMSDFRGHYNHSRNCSEIQDKVATAVQGEALFFTDISIARLFWESSAGPSRQFHS